MAGVTRATLEVASGIGISWYLREPKTIQHTNVWKISVTYLEQLYNCELAESRLLTPYAVED